MKNLHVASIEKYRLYFFMSLAFFACLWIGWRDFDPDMAQQLVRENIRASLRGIIQITVQYLAPVFILAYFASEAIMHRAVSNLRRKTGRS